MTVRGEIVGVGNVVAEITELKEARDTIARNLDAMVNTIATTVEYRDPYTAGDQRKVAEIAAAIAAELGRDAHEIDGIRKPGKLSAIEYELIKQHAEAGYSIVAGIDFPWPVAEMIGEHHERMDGSGYPHGRRGNEILLGARVIAVADVVEAMSAHRPYRPGWGVELAVDRIQRERRVRLDTDAVDACLQLFNTRRLTLG